MKHTIRTRVGGALLSFAMVLSLLPASALAVEDITSNGLSEAGNGSSSTTLKNLNDVNSWITDRQEPNNFTIEGGKITFSVKEQQQQNDWYDWQGRKAYTGAQVSSYWKVSYTMDVTESMLEQNNVNASLWIQVDEAGENGAASQQDCVDWAIIQCINTDTIKWQSWDAYGSGSWKDISDITTTAGTYTIDVEFANGYLTQYINGVQINAYNIGVSETAPVAVITQGKSFGAAFDVAMSVPTITTQAPEVVNIQTVDQLAAAIKKQQDGQTWNIAAGTYTLTQTQLDVYKDWKNPGESSQGGWYFPLYADDLTINGIGDVTITSDVATANGNWATQDFVSVWGDGITINGVDIQSKTEQNKAIEIMGQNFTLKNSTILPVVHPEAENQEVFSGSIFFNPVNEADSLGVSNLESVYLYSYVSASYASNGTLNVRNVTMDATNNMWHIWGIGYGPALTGNVYGEVSNVTYIIDEDAILTEILDSNYEYASDTKPGTTIKLTEDIALTEKLTINKDVTIDGQGHTITGVADNDDIYIEVTGGSFNIANVTLKDFGGAVGTRSGNGVIKVPSAATGVTVNATNVNVQDFNRSAYDIGAGSFNISGGTIDCTNSNTANTVLTKGIKVGGTANKVTGVISGVTIKNSASTYEDWNTAAIEVYSNADVDVSNCTISSVSKGIHVDNYWYDTGAITVDISGGTITADADAVMIYSKANATNDVKVNITGGTFTGNIQILDKTDKDTISIIGGTFSVDPSAYKAPGYYYVTKNNDGTWTVYYDAPSSGGSSSGSGNQTETEKNPDGSTTTTVTKPDGSTTETTKYPDGSSEVVETKKDGTTTTTTTDTEGNKTEVIENTDGSSKTTVDNKDGSSSTTTVSKNGQVEAEVKLTAAVVNEAADKGEAVALPMPEVPVTSDRDEAPTVTVTLPSSTSAKVEIPVKNVTSGTVAVLVKADGTEEIIKTTLTTENGVAVTLADSDTVKIVDNSKDFDDVSNQYWGASYIDFATSRNLFSGTSATTFAPETVMTRSMIVTVLASYDGANTAASDGEAWYAAGQQWAMENGISDGTNMDGNLNREQLALMLWNYAGKPAPTGNLNSFVDAGDTSDWAAQAMAWAVENGLISGMGNNALDPQGLATRAQVATIMSQFVALTA